MMVKKITKKTKRALSLEKEESIWISNRHGAWSDNRIRLLGMRV